MTIGEPVFQSYSHYHIPLPQLSSVNAWYPSFKPPFNSPTRPPDPTHWYKPQFQARHPSSDSTMSSNNPEEMETFQRLSDQYQPDLEGPLVGKKLQMSVLVREYAQADPNFVAKTVSLSATHSAYRPVQGDGQCGWRAAIFGYFETLLNLGDIDIVLQEITRIRSFNETMQIAGIEVELLIDMFDSTWELFEKVRQAVERGDKNENIILETFNDTGESNYILYHFKTMTSAFMQLNAGQYDQFLEMPLEDYRATRIDPAAQEIDQIGLQALTDGVIGPAGIALEVSYLDRSHGDVVTPHPFVPNATTWPTIRLLYRPGHYDMVYKDTQTVQVNLQHREAYDALDSADYANPNMNMDLSNLIFPDETVWQAPTHQRMYDTNTNPTQMAYASDSAAYDNTYVPRYSPIYTTYPSPGHMNHPPQYPQHWSSTGSADSIPVPSSLPMPRTSSTSSLDPTVSNPEPNIRFTLSQFSYAGQGRQTAPIDRSPSTHTHFNHENFQPEIYEYEHGGSGSGSGGSGVGSGSSKQQKPRGGGSK